MEFSLRLEENAGIVDFRRIVPTPRAECQGDQSPNSQIFYEIGLCFSYPLIGKKSFL